jgi:cobalamin biosynthesis protein CobD/CbiB
MKANPALTSRVDNIIAVTVYVVVAGLALSGLYRFVQKAVSH